MRRKSVREEEREEKFYDTCQTRNSMVVGIFATCLLVQVAYSHRLLSWTEVFSGISDGIGGSRGGAQRDGGFTQRRLLAESDLPTDLTPQQYGSGDVPFTMSQVTSFDVNGTCADDMAPSLSFPAWYHLISPFVVRL